MTQASGRGSSTDCVLYGDAGPDVVERVGMDHRRRPWLSASDGRAAAHRLGLRQHQVVGRRQLIAVRVARWLIRAEVAAGRWRELPGQVVVLHTGPLTPEARRWSAVLGAGPRAALDGVSALHEAGLERIDEHRIHVVAPRGAKAGPMPDVVVHESRRFREEDVITGAGIRRVRPAVAALHAALWAVSDRQAQLFVLAAAQQRLVTVEAFAEALSAVRRHPRRRLLQALARDMAGGVQSLGELDVAADFRRRGFPEPDRQEIRRRASGTEYLDCEFSAYAIVLEIDGAGHEDAGQKVTDLLRDISVAADGQVPIRIPLVLYRLAREQVLDRLEELLTARGWRRAA
jgi:hypothetical protein